MEHSTAIHDQPPATDMSAFELGAAHAGADPLDDQAAFQLGDDTNNDHHGAAQRAARVQLFAKAEELDVEMAAARPAPQGSG